ncbi:MAG: dihydroorotate dehydrogenase [Syntrophobacterales bacterium]|jgi:dihydroorotate dehydrogenase (NAD+) catalytic subunit|nr:dihydroorotate dehydrogenase [Syntrophobacterales bacterium]
MADTTVKLYSNTLRNPVMNGSGTLGYGKEIEPLWPIETLGAYVTKGLSLRPHHGNQVPRVWEERYGMINSIGLQNVGVTRFFDEYFPLFRKKNTPVIVNFFGFTEDEYVACAENIKPDPLIVGLEINLSCPNVKKGGISFGKDPDMVGGIIRQVKAVTPIPLIAKLTPEVKNIMDIACAAHEAGADGLTLINTIPAAAVDAVGKKVPIKGGLSGPALRSVALRAVYEISKAVPVPVIGSGGIMDYMDAVYFFMAGAKAVEIGTVTFVDPFAIPKIIDGIKDYMERERYADMDSIIGCAHCEDLNGR